MTDTTTDTPRLVLHVGEAEDRYARCGLCGTPRLDNGPGTSSADGDIRMAAVATNTRLGEPAKRVCNACADQHWPGARLAAAALDYFAAALLDAPTEAHRDFYHEAVKGQISSVMRMVCDAYPIASELLDQVVASTPRRTVLVAVDDPDTAAETLRAHMGAEDLRRLTLMIAD